MNRNDRYRNEDSYRDDYRDPGPDSGSVHRSPPYPRDQDFPRNPHRIYRNPANGWLSGVCAGLADYFGMAPLLVRFLMVCTWIVFPLGFLATIAYVVASFTLPKRPERPYRSRDEEQFWRSVSRAPGDTFGEMRHKLRSQEHRLRRMEAYVTSAQYEIDRELHRGSRS